MLRLMLIPGILCAALPAFAQSFTAEQRAACKGDYDAYCKGKMPGGGRVLACLGKHHDQLSATCKKIVDAQKK